MWNREITKWGVRASNIFKTLLLEDTIKNGYKLKKMFRKYLVQKKGEEKFVKL